MTVLLAYQHDRMCPKCHYMMGTTEYHQGWHGPRYAEYGLKIICPIGPEIVPPTWPSSYGLTESDEERERRIKPYEEAMAKWSEITAAIPEHFDRECPNCKHRWAEGVA